MPCLNVLGETAANAVCIFRSMSNSLRYEYKMADILQTLFSIAFPFFNLNQIKFKFDLKGVIEALA